MSFIALHHHLERITSEAALALNVLTSFFVLSFVQSHSQVEIFALWREDNQMTNSTLLTHGDLSKTNLFNSSDSTKYKGG